MEVCCQETGFQSRRDPLRFLDERNKNPVEALLAFVVNQRYMSVGELYQV